MNIQNINDKCGPLWGPNMRKLLDVMRERHGYSEFLAPAQFAQHVISALGDQALDVNQCPERFAGCALAAMGIDAVDVNAESNAFQRRAAFHFRK